MYVASVDLAAAAAAGGLQVVTSYVRARNF
jgi:hypothetical protein